MSRQTIYSELKAAVSSGSFRRVKNLLSDEAIDDIHGYFCEELPEELESVCVSCEALLRPALRQQESGMVEILLRHGAYPPVHIILCIGIPLWPPR